MALRAATLADLNALTALEARSYPADEAASRETLKLRLTLAPECTALREDDSGLVGFVCSTRARGETLTEASMHEHVAGGETLCIHSVVIDPERRRRGLGSQMMREYLNYAAELPDLERIALIAKAHLVEFYRDVGFELVGPSRVVHGKDPWFELRTSI
jgi:ribosomal protein S18 acetylase RimI-like enzyme